MKRAAARPRIALPPARLSFPLLDTGDTAGLPVPLKSHGGKGEPARGSAAGVNRREHHQTVCSCSERLV